MESKAVEVVNVILGDLIVGAAVYAKLPISREYKEEIYG